MDSNINEEDAEITVQNIAYYNEIAPSYDAILSEDVRNTLIRKQVEAKCIAAIKGGKVIDFGGGTGQDIEWMQQHYQVVFCEPSTAMREIAIARNKNTSGAENISFLEDTKVDFRTWTATFPFEEKADGLLANFAVINCIPDIDLLFNSFAQVVKPGGSIIALILDARLHKRLRTNLKGTLRSIFIMGPVQMNVTYNNLQQQVYLHKISSVKKAAGDNFTLAHADKIEGSGFCLVHLIRK